MTDLVLNLVLKGGRVIDPANGGDETTDVAFSNGRITQIGRELLADGTEIRDVRELAPGARTDRIPGRRSGSRSPEALRQASMPIQVDANDAIGTPALGDNVGSRLDREIGLMDEILAGLQLRAGLFTTL